MSTAYFDRHRLVVVDRPAGRDRIETFTPARRMFLLVVFPVVVLATTALIYAGVWPWHADGSQPAPSVATQTAGGAR